MIILFCIVYIYATIGLFAYAITELDEKIIFLWLPLLIIAIFFAPIWLAYKAGKKLREWWMRRKRKGE